MGAHDQSLHLTVELGQAFGLCVRLAERCLQIGEALGIANSQQFAHTFELLFGGFTQCLELQLAQLLNAGEDFAADLLQKIEVGFLNGLQFFRVEKRHA
ncbi:hypothetical protein D3C72_2007890 [compost metagenome]